MKKSILTILGLVALIFFGNLVSQAKADVSATVTADNHYGLYYGALDGSGLTLVGRNEVGPDGSPGAYSWSFPEAYTFGAPAGDYLYMLVWDDEKTQSWIGEFTLPDASLLYSSTADWEFYVSSNSNPGSFGALPSLGTVSTDIAGAVWGAPLASTPNGGGDWGIITGISPSADFIWHDTFGDVSSSDANYVIFKSRLPIPEVPGAGVPEPASMLLFGMGSGLLGFVRNRKKN